jgi:hypothetical protein
MKLKRAIAALLVLLLAMAAALGVAGLVLYRNPSAVRLVVEKLLSDRLGVPAFIEDLNYSLNPLELHAAKVSARDADGALFLQLKRLDAAFKLEGPFGRRTLAVERLALAGVTILADGRLREARLPAGGGPPSLLGRLAARAAAVLFFRDLRIGTVALSEGSVELRGDGLELSVEQLRAGSTADGLVEVNGSARVRWPEAGADLEIPGFRLRLKPDLCVDRSRVEAHLNLPQARYDRPGMTAGIADLETRLSLAMDAERLEIGTAEAECRALTLKPAGTDETVLPDLRLNASGEYARRKRVLTVSGWQLGADKMLALRGRGELKLGAPFTVRVDVNEGTLFPQEMAEKLLAAAGARRAPLSIAGPLAVSGRLVLTAGEEGWAEEGRLALAFNENAVSARLEGLDAKGLVSGSLEASGSAAAPEVALRLSGKEFTFSAGGVKAAPLSFALSASGVYPAFSVPLLEVRAAAVTFAEAERTAALTQLALQAKNGKIDAEKAAVSFPEIAASALEVHGLRGSLAGDREALVIEAAGSDTGAVAAAAGFGFLPAGWRLSASDRIQAKAVLRPRGESRLSATLALKQLGFADAGDRCAGEGIELNAEIEARTHPKEKSLAATARLSSGAGEVLCEGFYLDLGQNPATVSAALRHEPQAGKLAIDGGGIELENLLAISTRGQLTLKGGLAAYDLTLEVPALPAAPLFETLVAEPLRHRQPFLSGLKVDGLFSAEVRLSGGGDLRAARGVVEWRAGQAATADAAIRLEGIDLRLPLWYAPGPVEGPPLNGLLSVRKMELPGLPDQGLRLPFTVGPGRFDTADELHVRFPSGEVRIGAVSGRGLFSGRPKISTTLEVERVQAGSFLKGLWSEPVSAVVNGRLAEVAFDGNSVSSRGRLAADIFGGKVFVENLGVRAALGAAPNVHLDLAIQDLNLDRATRNTSFGRIQGVLGGYVKDLEIVGLEPQRFMLELETRRTPGIPQRINVAAVENIARIGGGASPFAGLAGNFAAFFKEFTYDRIGMRAVLENDIFQINGTVKENGVEYLVRKGGIPGVDVVNLNPENRISFKDMVKRIQRVTESGSGPVIK